MQIVDKKARVKMKVLIATDGSDFSKAAVAESCGYIDPQNTEFRIVSACDDTAFATEAYGMTIEYHKRAVDAFRQQAGAALKDSEAMIRECFKGQIVRLTTKILTGQPEQEIVKEAEDWGADLIVVGSQGRGFWDRQLMGSVSTGVLHHAPCSVLVVRRKQNV
jgi:nucleotide-binding universal stress UspA family protein